MDEKIEKQIVFSFLIIVIVLFGISQVLPWATLNAEYLGENRDVITFYSLGATQEINTGGNQSSFLYLMIFFETIDFVGELPAEENAEQIEHMKTYSIGFFVMFVAWIVSLSVIIFSSVALYNLYNLKFKKMKTNIFNSSIFSIILLFTFYIAINFLILGSFKSLISSISESTFSFISATSINLNLNFSAGFILFLIGTIFITSLAIFNASRNFSKRMSGKKLEEEYEDERSVDVKQKNFDWKKIDKNTAIWIIGIIIVIIIVLFLVFALAG